MRPVSHLCERDFANGRAGSWMAGRICRPPRPPLERGDGSAAQGSTQWLGHKGGVGGCRCHDRRCFPGHCRALWQLSERQRSQPHRLLGFVDVARRSTLWVRLRAGAPAGGAERDPALDRHCLSGHGRQPAPGSRDQRPGTLFLAESRTAVAEPARLVHAGAGARRPGNPWLCFLDRTIVTGTGGSPCTRSRSWQ